MLLRRKATVLKTAWLEKQHAGEDDKGRNNVDTDVSSTTEQDLSCMSDTESQSSGGQSWRYRQGRAVEAVDLLDMDGPALAVSSSSKPSTDQGVPTLAALDLLDFMSESALAPKAVRGAEIAPAASAVAVPE